MGQIVIGQTNKKIRLRKLQQTSRNTMSDPEQALWHLMRCRQISGLKFRGQHPFGDYILDFVCLENKRVIEVDGGQQGQQAGYDENRTEKLQAAGFRVLRFWNNEVLKEIESVTEKIGLVVQELQPHPSPNLPPCTRRKRLRCAKGKELRKFPLKGRENKVSAYAHRGEEVINGYLPLGQNITPKPLTSIPLCPAKDMGQDQQGERDG